MEDKKDEVTKKEKGLSIHEIDGKTVITAPTGAVYLSEFMITLPSGILNKKETGCGATTLVLENQENVIIACPTKQMIVNKVSQYPNKRCSYELFSVQSGVSQDDIERYIYKCKGKQPIKIMVTYDSFPKVNAIIKQQELLYKVVVDEYQEMLNAYSYRSTVIRNLLSELKDQSDVTYLSATPIPYKFKPEELHGLPEYEIEWKDTIKTIPFRIQDEHPSTLAANIIRNHKRGHPFEMRGHIVQEYFFFVNSVSTIKSIIRTAGLLPEEVKIICGNNDANKKKLDGFSIDDATGKNKTFTFCTKTVFYGADFHSKAGLVIVVSEGYAKSSLLDISTDILQITGRVRTKENPFKDIILHIYNTGNMCESKAEYEMKLRTRLDYAQKTIEAYNMLPVDLRSTLTCRIKYESPEEFVFYNDKKETIEIDKLKIAHTQYMFEVVDNVYNNGISVREAYIKAGYNMKDAEHYEQSIRDNIYFGIRNSNFEVYYKTYSKERMKSPNVKSALAVDIEQKCDIIPLAYNLLGDEKVQKLGYNESKVRDHVHFHLPETQAALKEELKITFKEGNAYSLKEIKYQLGLCFQKLRIGFTAKATMLSPYFKTRSVKVQVQGIRKDGLKILSKCFMAISFKKNVEF